MKGTRAEQRRDGAVHGTALVEFLLTLPVLVILIVGLVNLGIAVAQYHNLQRVVYESANYGSSVPGISSLLGRARVSQFLSNLLALPDQDSHVDLVSAPQPTVAYVAQASGGIPARSVVVSLSGRMQVFLGEHVNFSATSISPYFVNAGNAAANYQIFENPSALVNCNRQSTSCSQRSCGSTTPCPP